MRVAAVQMCSGNRWEANRERAAQFLDECAALGARVALLPENFSLMAANHGERRALAEADSGGPVQSFLSETAKRLGLWIVGGTTPLLIAGFERIAQACLVYDDRGQRVARYDKLHLFDVDLPERGESYRESSYIQPGERPITVDTPAGRLGLSICYDMRFPELYRTLQAEGATWFSMPSAFTVPTGQAHWETLLRARAIENLCYVAAAGQCGSHPNGRDTWGHTLLIDYWGRILAQRADGEGVVIAEFDAAAQSDARRTFPVLGHRRLRDAHCQP